MPPSMVDAVCPEEQVPGSRYEIQIINHFFEAASNGYFPGGHRVLEKLMPKETVVELSKPYREWAPPSFWRLDMPCILRVMTKATGLDNIMSMIVTSTPDLDINVNYMKSRIWEGVQPIPQCRWDIKKLDDRSNIEDALAYMTMVVDVFKYIAKPEIQGAIRDANNSIVVEFSIFMDAMVAANAEKSQAAPDYDLSKLYMTYMNCHFAMMIEQARSWIFTHIKTLHIIWKDHLMQVFNTGRTLPNGQSVVRINHYAIAILNRIHDLAWDADLYIRARTEGFMLNHIDARFSDPTGSRTASQTNAIYAKIENERMAMLNRDFDRLLRERVEQERPLEPVPDFMESMSACFHREWVHRGIQAELLKPLERHTEGWVSHLLRSDVPKFGFVIYRLSHKSTDDEWAKVKRKVYAGINSGWDGVVGLNEALRLKASLHWIERREQISEDDLGAAKKHFEEFSASSTFPVGLSKTMFLAMTNSSVLSYSQTKEGDLNGDFRGFLYVVDAKYDGKTESSATKARSSSTASSSRQPPPHQPKETCYEGHAKVVDQLVWPDVYGLCESRHALTVRQMWDLARSSGHPWGVYVGPTIASQRKNWAEIRTCWATLVHEVKEKRQNLPVR